MSTRQWWQIVSAILVGTSAAVALWLVLARIWPILVLFALGAALAQLLDPYLNRLKKRGWTRLQAVWLVSLVGIVVLGLLMTWLVPTLLMQVESLAKAWPSYTAKAQALYDKTNEWILSHVEPPETAKRYQAFLDERSTEFQVWLAQKLPVVLGWISGQVFRGASFFLILLMLLLIVFHFMLIIDAFRESVKSVLPEAAVPHVTVITKQIGLLVGQYFRGLLTSAACVAVLSALGLWLLGLVFGTRHGLLIGLLAGVLYVVPWIGGAIVQVLAIFFGYTTATRDPGWSALASWAVVFIVNQGCDTLLMPAIVGRRVGLHPLAVLFGILCGYQLFGVAGVILATPIMVSVKIILAHWLPVKGIPATERAPREPLELDLGATASKVYGLARAWGGLLERAFVRQVHIPEDETEAGGADTGKPDAQPPPNQDSDTSAVE